MRYRRIAVWMTAILTSMFLTTGCWDRIEIEERATVLGLSIDPATEEVAGVTGPAAKSVGRGFQLTAQVAIPGRTPLGPGGGSGGTSSAKPVWVITASGKTMDDAMNNLQSRIAEKIFLGHLRIIIVNQTIAQSGALNDIQDFLRRNAEIRRLAWLLVSTGNAKDAMAASPKLERVPTLYLVNMMDQAVKLGRMPNIFLGNFWSVLGAKGQEPVLPLISVQGVEQIRTQGLAVFRQGIMVAALDPLETATFMEIQNQKRSGYALSVPMPADSQHSIIIRGTSRMAKRVLRMTNRRPAFDVYTRLDSNVEEKTGKASVDTVIDQVEAQLTSLLAGRQKELIMRMQSLHTDIFGFGENVRAQRPRYWMQNIKTRERWEQAFTTLQVNVHPKVYIRRSGMSAH